MAVSFVVTVILSLLQLVQAQVARNLTCKCIPSNPCWPDETIWATFNKSLSGKLIKTVPVAAPCYPGIYANQAECAIVQEQWTNTSFLSQFPLGYSYPHSQPCDLPGGNTTHVCRLGDSAVYAVNASTVEEVIDSVNFARRRNLRVVVKTTGHDMLGRSTGYGSLEIWLRYLRLGVKMGELYSGMALPVNQYNQSPTWNGKWIELSSGYNWADVNAVAAAHGVIVVGGGCPSVGVLGGFMQGGGHSRATHDFGLAADQLLEAQVILYNGEQVLASPNSHKALYRALRGGGGGTYGIITSAKIKAYRDAPYVVQFFSMMTSTKPSCNQAAFMEAVAIVFEAMPALADGGLGGYGVWQAYDAGGGWNASMSYAFGAREKSAQEMQSLFEPTLQKLLPYNGTCIHLTVSYTTYDSYWDYYYGTGGGVCTAATANFALVSRLFPSEDLSDKTALRKMLNRTAGLPFEGVINGFALLGGKALFQSDALSGVNPAWRRSYVHYFCGRGWSDQTGYQAVEAIRNDITYTKGEALREFAPSTGVYMNEADWRDPSYLQDFYGEQLPSLVVAKMDYDPEDFFYCPTCVGSDAWRMEKGGSLCRD